MTSAVRVRIAPSPTGTLHLGTARTALYNYLYAKRHKGDFILRLEDTDEERSKEEYTQDILDGLKWLGIHWDEGPDIGGPFPPYRQTEKVDHYEKFAHKLISSGKAYFCYCKPEELETLKEEQKANGQAPRYDNRCRNLNEQQVAQFEKEGRIPVIRFKVEEPHMISWHDAIKGEISIASSDLGGDMVIVKSSGVAIYNFAVVIDDIDMKMTHVIRGEDHIHNTAKQILIYEALGQQHPVFAHAALIFDIERHKLSKRRHGEAVHIDKYRQDGYMPEAMVNYLAQMSWTPPNGQEIFTLEEAGNMFDLDKVSKSPAVFDVPRLNWFNSQYIRHLPLSVIIERAAPYLAAYDVKQYSAADLEKIVALVRDGLTMLSEITAATQFFFVDKIEIDEETKDTVFSKPSANQVIEKILASLSEFPFGDSKGCKAVVDKIGKEVGVSGKDLFWPVRAALCGSTHGPDLGSTISLLGPARIKQRLESTMKSCSKA